MTWTDEYRDWIAAHVALVCKTCGMPVTENHCGTPGCPCDVIEVTLRAE